MDIVALLYELHNGAAHADHVVVGVGGEDHHSQLLLHGIGLGEVGEGVALFVSAEGPARDFVADHFVGLEVHGLGVAIAHVSH